MSDYTVLGELSVHISTVSVSLPWESYTYIPQESSVYINCTTESSQNPGWTIQLPSQTATLQFTFPASIRTLNDHIFYQLPEIDLGMTMKTIRLLINSTMRINGTVVRCDDTGTAILITHTTLFEFDGKYSIVNCLYIGTDPDVLQGG